jgi:hypothetical protein
LLHLKDGTLAKCLIGVSAIPCLGQVDFVARFEGHLILHTLEPPSTWRTVNLYPFTRLANVLAEVLNLRCDFPGMKKLSPTLIWRNG